MTAELRRRGWCVHHERTERLMTNTIVARDGGADESARRSPTSALQRSLILCAGTALSLKQVLGLVGTSPPSRRARAGCLSPRCSISADSGSLVPRWARPCPKSSGGCAIDMAITTRSGEVWGMIFHLDRGSQYLIERLPGALWEARHRLIRRPGRFAPRQEPGGILTGQSSSGSSSAVPTSRPEPRPDTPSAPGSGTTTPPGDTARFGTSRPSSGSCAIDSGPWTPHHLVSGRRGEARRVDAGVRSGHAFRTVPPDRDPLMRRL
jgi:hypothetical protein